MGVVSQCVLGSDHLSLTISSRHAVVLLRMLEYGEDGDVCWWVDERTLNQLIVSFRRGL